MAKEEEKKLDKKTLREKVSEAKRRLLTLRLKKSTGELDKFSEIDKTKKEIARLLTALNKKD
ncbi:50S ribosomal protein L29 [Pseudomonadota bacterium]